MIRPVVHPAPSPHHEGLRVTPEAASAVLRRHLSERDGQVSALRALPTGFNNLSVVLNECSPDGTLTALLDWEFAGWPTPALASDSPCSGQRSTSRTRPPRGGWASPSRRRSRP